MTQPWPPEGPSGHPSRHEPVRNQTIPELFAEPPVRSELSRRRGPPYVVRRLITILVLVGIVGGGVYWGVTHLHSSIPGEIPTIKAEGPYKQRPEQPGGIDIPHQDVQVYEALDNNAPPKPEVEHLLPPPETPTAPPAVHPQTDATPEAPQLETLAMPAVKTDAAPVPEAAPAASVAPAPVAVPAPAAVSPRASALQPVQNAAPTTPKAADPKALTVAPVSVASASVSKPQPVSAPVKIAQTANPAPSMDQVLKNVTSGTPDNAKGPAIQLASIPDQNAAQAEMKRLQGKYADILGPQSLHLVKADLGDRGIYYRIQTRASSDQQAKDMCAAIKNLNGGCIIVR